MIKCNRSQHGSSRFLRHLLLFFQPVGEFSRLWILDASQQFLSRDGPCILRCPALGIAENRQAQSRPYFCPTRKCALSPLDPLCFATRSIPRWTPASSVVSLGIVEIVTTASYSSSSTIIALCSISSSLLISFGRSSSWRRSSSFMSSILFYEIKVPTYSCTHANQELSSSFLLAKTIRFSTMHVVRTIAAHCMIVAKTEESHGLRVNYVLCFCTLILNNRSALFFPQLETRPQDIQLPFSKPQVQPSSQ